MHWSELSAVPLMGIIRRALGLDCYRRKLVPASDLSTGELREAGPFPEVRFVATGGMSMVNAAEFLAAGAAAVALGSSLSEPSQLQQVRAFLGAGRVTGQP